MALNATLSPTIIAKTALKLLVNNLVMGQQVYRDFEAEFPGNPKKGGTVTIRKPVKFRATKARTRTSSVITENSITLTVSTQAHISWAFEMDQLTLTIEEYADRYLRPACAQLANVIDQDLCALYDDVYNSVVESTGFVSPATFMVLGKAMQKMDEEAAETNDRVVVLNPAAHWSLANALVALYQQEPGTAALRKGYLGRIAGAEIFMDQNIKVHSTGNWGGSGAIASTDATGKEIATAAPTGTRTAVLQLCDFDLIDTAVLANGDVFTIAGVYAVNPMSGESTGSLRQFCVTAAASCGSTGTTTEVAISVYIAPEICATGPYKTVGSFPSGGAAVDVLGLANHDYPQNLAFHKNAFALVMVPLEKPTDEWGATYTENGYSIRVVKQYAIDNDVEVCRLDVLYGVKTIYPELAVRVWGAEAGT